jgi:cyclopropane fatty-acyl-phospholipid synthase-like methyltransferase
MQQPDWFKDWFDSPYYHILYKNRDEKEAAVFIDHLADYLGLNQTHRIWDLACGKGRHSLYLSKKGLHVTGTDLSENSIHCASQSENEHLEFYVHDMRTTFRLNYFTHVFNLFTSIGYFENYKDNLKVFKNVYASLKSGGIFVVDFFNADYVESHLVKSDLKVVEGISFYINKTIQDGHVMKTITFSDKGQDYKYCEKVSLLSLKDFTSFSEASGFRIKATFGDYKFSPFDKTNSERLILILEK